MGMQDLEESVPEFRSNSIAESARRYSGHDLQATKPPWRRFSPGTVVFFSRLAHPASPLHSRARTAGAGRGAPNRRGVACPKDALKMKRSGPFKRSGPCVCRVVLRRAWDLTTRVSFRDSPGTSHRQLRCPDAPKWMVLGLK